MATVLEEKDAIHETIANYCFHFDGAEFDKWVDLFAEDGTFEAGPRGVHKGKEALRKFVKNVPLTGGSPMMKHCDERDHQSRWREGDGEKLYHSRPFKR
jgi:hypothetical protein